MIDDGSIDALLPGQYRPAFKRYVRTISEGVEHPYRPEEWRGALVVVAEGQIDLLCADGGTLHFGQGSVLLLDDLPVRAIRASGDGGATLAAISRTRSP